MRRFIFGQLIPIFIIIGAVGYFIPTYYQTKIEFYALYGITFGCMAAGMGCATALHEHNNSEKQGIIFSIVINSWSFFPLGWLFYTMFLDPLFPEIPLWVRIGICAIPLYFFTKFCYAGKCAKAANRLKVV